MGDTGTTTTAAGLSAGMVVIFLVMMVFILWVYAQIVKKAGYSGWYVLLGLIPIVNLVMFLIFAFSKWPVESEVEALRAAMGAAPGQYGRGGQAPAGYPPAGYGPGYPQGGVPQGGYGQGGYGAPGPMYQPPYRP